MGREFCGIALAQAVGLRAAVSDAGAALHAFCVPLLQTRRISYTARLPSVDGRSLIEPQNCRSYFLSEFVGVSSEFVGVSNSNKAMSRASRSVPVLHLYLAFRFSCFAGREPSNRVPSCVVRYPVRISSFIAFTTRSVVFGGGPRVPRRFLGRVPRRSLGCVPAVSATVAAASPWSSESAAGVGSACVVNGRGRACLAPRNHFDRLPAWPPVIR